MKASWAWRKNYRVWEAKRQVFLFPENWTELELRPSSPAQFPSDEIVKTAQAQRTSVLFTSATGATALSAGGDPCVEREPQHGRRAGAEVRLRGVFLKGARASPGLRHQGQALDLSYFPKAHRACVVLT